MTIYSAGACKENYRAEGIAGGEGGWAFIILEDKPGEDMEVVIQNSDKKIGTTNQCVEILAVIEAMKSIKYAPGQINLYSSNANVINCLKDKWYHKWRSNEWINSKGDPIENRDEWESMIGLVEKYSINPIHVKRGTTKFIRMVEDMARQASKK